MQGVGVAEARLSGRARLCATRSRAHADGRGAIIDHADVRRMLATMQAEIFAARAIALACAVAIDMARATGEPDWAARAAFLTPDRQGLRHRHRHARSPTSAIQVHGGMGFIEETGVAQFCRDVRVTAIYEGTNGIQAMDLVGRKMADGGEAAFRLLEEIEAAPRPPARRCPSLPTMSGRRPKPCARRPNGWWRRRCTDRFAGAVPYLRGLRPGSGRALPPARRDGRGRHGRARRWPRFYIRRLLPAAYTACWPRPAKGLSGLYALSPDELAS